MVINWTVTDHVKKFTVVSQTAPTVVRRYTLFQSFFHVLLHNSEFCEAWVNENNHFMIWLSDKGCQCDWHKDEADWCGCSPLVIRQKDYDSTLKVRSLFVM